MQNFLSPNLKSNMLPGDLAARGERKGALELVAQMAINHRENVPQGLKPKLDAPVAARDPEGTPPCPFNARFMQPVLES
jgi:hypothetical protein